MSNEMRKSLKDRAKQFEVSLPFMDGREKGDNADLIGQITNIVDYGFLPNEDGELYAVFIVKERSKKFYFGGSVLTERLSQLDAEGYGDDIREEGLPMLMTKTKSKNGRFYSAVKFYPEG